MLAYKDLVYECDLLVAWASSGLVMEPQVVKKSLYGNIPLWKIYLYGKYTFMEIYLYGKYECDLLVAWASSLMAMEPRV